MTDEQNTPDSGEPVVDAVVAEPVAATPPPVVEEKPLDDNKVLKQLRALAVRSALGVSEKMPLRVPGEGRGSGWEDVEDDTYYIQFRDPAAEAIDGMRDALEQYKEVAQYYLDEGSEQVVGDQEVTRQRRSWPVIEVLLEFRLIADAVLPEVLKDGVTVKPRRWADQKGPDREFLQRA